METLFAIGMMVGLVRSSAKPPKPPAPIAQAQIEQPAAERHVAEAAKNRPSKKSEWQLSY